MYLLDKLQDNSAQIVYALIAITGGVARYFSSYTMGTPFNVRMFFASVFVSGFSGYMFSLVGLSMDLPSSLIFMMAGTGGFLGDQTMKYVTEYVNRTTNTS